nr:hypothetical protein [Tanacetum cinerariifolium]
MKKDDKNKGTPNAHAKKFNVVLEEAKKELYPGCKYSVLSFIVKLYRSKCIGKYSEKGFTMMLDTLRETFPDASIPNSFYEVKKVIRDLGLSYDKIDACPNDCMLYRKTNSEKTKCDICGTSRYKPRENDSKNQSAKPHAQKKIAAKVLRHFPLKPRLQKLFMSPKIVASMRWYDEGRTKDGCLRHPANSPTWKKFDFKYPDLAKEPRNVRLGLASDGFNPFRNMNNSHTPGNNIDVYLEPLVEELKELWDDEVETYDASTKTKFEMHASLLWTITPKAWGKYCYTGHRRYLPKNHSFRKDKKSFDGTNENANLPSSMTGLDVIKELNGYIIKFGKEYWKDNLLCHNLDVIHIEKNVCDSLVGTLMNLDGKTKDHIKARLDLQEMGIRPELHSQPRNRKKFYLPPACFSMDKKEKETFCNVLKKVKVPDGYVANISRCVQLKPPKIFGLKSHDNHILMQQLLSLALRNMLPKHVRSALMKLCCYYRQLCSKVLKPHDLVQMENETGKILCDLERVFPPSLFDVMIHLSVRLDLEAKIGGPVHYHWMYPIKRYLSTLKSYVQNKSIPEGSIIEGYIVEECLSFCSLYLSPDVETEHNRKSQIYDDGGSVDVLPIFLMSGHQVGATTMKIEKLHMTGDQRIIEELRALASGPAEVVKNYKGFIINGFRFQIKELERDVAYYGVINDIIELEYSANKKVVLFDCDWISNDRRKNKDENGFALLNFKGLKPHNEPFILASQAKQVLSPQNFMVKLIPRTLIDIDGVQIEFWTPLVSMPSRRDNRVCNRRFNNSQQAEDVTEVGSDQPNIDQGCASTAQKVALIWKKYLRFVVFSSALYTLGMPSRRDNRVSTRGRNSSQQVEDVTEVGSNQPNNSQVPGNARKRVRGPTFMPKVWTKTDKGRISVQFNEYGQPVDETTNTLTHFIGSLARSEKYCKLHKPWNKVKNAKKQILLDTVNDKFDLPPGSNDWILKSFGRKVKNLRARVEKDYYDPTLPFHEQIIFKLKRVLASQWKRLVKYWNKGKSKVILGREPTRKELFRACFSIDGITQNEEAANAIEQIEELTSQLSEQELDEPGPQDIYSKVMGNDKNGTAEMYGLGVRAYDVWGVVPSRSACHKDKLQWKSTADRLNIELAKYKTREAQRQGSSDNNSDGTNVPQTSLQGLIVSNEPQPLRVGLQVYLKSISSSEIVAKGWIRSLDPDEVVGSEEIRPNWCQVDVQVAIRKMNIWWYVRMIDNG